MNMSINTKDIIKPALVIVVILALFVIGENYSPQDSNNDQKPENSPSDGVTNPDNLSGPGISDNEAVSAIATSEPSGKVIYWMNINSNNQKYKFEHYCDGFVKLYKNDANHSGLAPSDSTYYYCIGRNQLFLNLDGKLSMIKDEIVSDAKDALLFTDIKRLSSGVVLISYSANACVTVNNCGVGMPSNYVTIAFNLADNTFREIKKYPSRGEAIWNRSGTKAVFYPETCGGAGCDEGSIVGYNLESDESKDVSSEKAAYDSYNCGNGKNCWADCGSPDSNGCLSVWDNLYWLDDDKVSATIISPNGEKQEISIIF